MTCSRCPNERPAANLTTFGDELLCPECLAGQAATGYKPLGIRGYQNQIRCTCPPAPAAA